MTDKQQIKPGTSVVDTNGKTVGVVGQVTDDSVILTAEGFNDGLHHFVPLAAVKGLQDGKLLVEAGEESSTEAVAGAAEFSRSTAGSGGGDGLFGTSGHGTGFGGSGSGH